MATSFSCSDSKISYLSRDAGGDGGAVQVVEILIMSFEQGEKPDELLDVQLGNESH